MGRSYGHSGPGASRPIMSRASIQSLALNSQGELLLSGLFTEEVILGQLKLSNFEGFQNYIACLQTGIYTNIGQAMIIPDLKVFPNPGKDKVQIMNPGQSGHINFMIFNGNGSLVLSGRAGSGECIDIGPLPAGQYLLRLVDLAENSARSCIFIKR